jgi:hypothetical protein
MTTGGYLISKYREFHIRKQVIRSFPAVFKPWYNNFIRLEADCVFKPERL